jgi:ArsR family transcriptional regulator
MEAQDVVQSLAALAQPVRLQVFRALVVAGPAGLTPGELVEAIAVPGTSLSFHLKELTHSGLVTQERHGRNLIYRAAFGRVNALIAYLTENCCEDVACEIEPATTCDC